MAAECPCGLPQPYPACCGRFHAGDSAPTAERLMRSRYAAFAVGNAAYLRLTWDPSTRPRRTELDATDRWTGLEILGHTAGGPLDVEGTVEFRAHYEAHHEPGVIHENSLFRKAGGRWRYVGPA